MFFRFLSILKIFIPLVLVMVEICCAQISALTEKLIVQLGCPYCHSSLQLKPDFQNKIPNLSYAGLRYNPAYLFDFLQNPEKIRRHIGISTMPNFHFSRPEALGLVLFLETQNQIDDLWPDYPSGLKKATSDLSGLESPIPPVPSSGLGVSVGGTIQESSVARSSLASITEWNASSEPP